MPAYIRVPNKRFNSDVKKPGGFPTPVKRSVTEEIDSNTKQLSPIKGFGNVDGLLACFG